MSADARVNIDSAAFNLAKAMYSVGFDDGYQHGRSVWSKARRPFKGNAKALERAVKIFAKVTGLPEQEVLVGIGAERNTP